MTYKTFRDIDRDAWNECERYGVEVVNDSKEVHDKLSRLYDKFYQVFNVHNEETQKEILDTLVNTWGRSDCPTPQTAKFDPFGDTLNRLFDGVFHKLKRSAPTRRASLYVLQHFAENKGHCNLYALMYPPVASGNGSTEATQPTTTQEETNMNALTANIKIETRTFITAPGLNDRDANTLTADTIIAAIAEAEKAVKELNTIENKPKVLQEKIDSLNDGVRKLVELLDARSA